MIDEPDIVKILRNEEKLRLLLCKSESNCEKLTKVEKSSDIGTRQIEEIDEKDNQIKMENIKLTNIGEVYKTIFENSAVAITVTDENEKIIFWNKYAENLLDMEKDDLYLKPVKSLYPSDEWEKIRSENVRQKGMQHRLETKILRKDNEPFDVDISLSVLKDHEDKIIGSIGVIKDISERKKAEKELKETHELLRIANTDLERKVEKRTSEVKNLLRQKDDFIGQLGHDLKTPISVILTLLPMIKDEVKDEDASKDCNAVIRNGEYIKNLVTETIQIAELSSPNVTFDIESLILDEIINDVVRDLHIIFEDNNIQFKNNINKDVTIKGNRLRLGELFGNLITNAVKYTHENGGTITIDAKEEKDQITVSITDTGIGITEEQKKHIFDEFYKVDESRHEISSVGLGLSICKRIIEKHGGKIWVESHGLGKGSTFHFTLKLGYKKP